MILSEPLRFYCNDKSLRFHIINVGEGLMVLIIFPNNQVMLFDCNVTEDRVDDVLTYLSREIPYNYDEDTRAEKQVIHYFVNSHRDEDHYRGLKKVNEKFPIKSIWDSGQSGATTQSEAYQYYMALRRRLKEKDENNLRVLGPSDMPVANLGGVSVFCFSGKEGYRENYNNDMELFEESAKIQHTNSLVLQLEYNSVALLLTGDSDWKSWKEKIIPNFGQRVRSDILVASHHGSRSFFTDEENDSIDVEENPNTTYIKSIDYIDPDIILISCGKYESQHHPNKDALKIYRQGSENEQVYTTNDKGHLVGYMDNCGNYTVVPSRFFNNRICSSVYDMQIVCKYEIDGQTYDVVSGNHLRVGGVLRFSLKTSGGIIEPIDKVTVWWEVSNGGKNRDKSHQEIYYKKRNEKDGLFGFSRELSYRGTHLLRCRLKNGSKREITRVFCVIGI